MRGEDGISGLKDTKVFVQINGKIGKLECRGHRNLRCHLTVEASWKSNVLDQEIILGISFHYHLS
ncbi:hypothetical protein HanXRQr2_Chr04g0153431 [Helianthus annuus]|uniref:Uncharacterized protein n=1 Tax=Helianthus annuus TaxID=4232 RepID=A0A9K3J742_HELAN|nr:hypothetical protein HanXRQr2_Chr04g0153431 [Helianthus annuus]